MGRKKKKGKKQQFNLNDPNWNSKIAAKPSSKGKKTTSSLFRSGVNNSKGSEKKEKVEPIHVKDFSYTFKGNEKTQQILELFKHILGETKYNEVDAPVFHFFCSIIDNFEETQQIGSSSLKTKNDCLSFLEDKMERTIGFSKESTRLFLIQLEEKGLIHFPEEIIQEETIEPLKQTLSFGKTLEEEQLLDESYSLMMEGQDQKKKKVGGGTNYNDKIDWDEQKMKELEQKRMLKKQKIEQKKRREYEEYVRQSGLSKQKGYVRIHRREEMSNFKKSINAHIDNLSIGNSELLKDTDLRLNFGVKYGLTGRNGVGKTTLLRGLVERSFPDIPFQLQILHVEQEVEASSDHTPVEILLKTDAEREQLLKEEEEILNGEDDDKDERLNEIYERLNEIEAHLAESKVREILFGLSFTPEMQEKKLKELSGGWRKRVSIARALFIEPDILLMDEPENHLDLHALIWLENYLLKLKNCTLVLVSHSKDFLNSISQEIIHFHNSQLSYYKGNYYQFEKLRSQKLMENKKIREATMMQKAHIQKFVDRFRYKAGRASLVQSRIKALDKMRVIPAMVEEDSFSFDFPDPELPIANASQVLIQTINVEFGYTPEQLLLKNVNFVLTKDSRVALVGKNGIGKSTFMNILVGDLKPTQGEVQLDPKVRIAKFSQHHANALDLSLTPIEYISQNYPKVSEQTIRNHLGKMGLKARTHNQPIYTLSGGEKSRVVFTEITINRPNMILLDEPSNHLDLDTVDALVNAINNFEGPIVLISHDSYLISRTCDHIFQVKDKGVKLFKGDFMKYKEQILM